VTSSTTKAIAGVALAALAAAAVAAAVNYRRGQKPDPEVRAHLEELDARLNEAEEPGSDTSPGRIGRILDSLQRNRGVSVWRLRTWIIGVKQGTLSPEQATVAESDFDALERHADQGGV
jgi:anti-sigma-K factor RskA